MQRYKISVDETSEFLYERMFFRDEPADYHKKYLNLTIMKSVSLPNVIHLFALAHAALTLICRYSGIDDSMLLTMLTMLMAVIICVKRGISVEITATCVIFVNIVGFLLGTGVAKLLISFMEYSPMVHATASVCTTEILGWSLMGFTTLFKRAKDNTLVPNISWIVVACAIILVIRYVYGALFSSLYNSSGDVYNAIELFLSNATALLISLCLNIIFARWLAKRESDSRSGANTVLTILFVILLSAFMAILVGYDMPFFRTAAFEQYGLLPLFLVGILVETTIYCCTSMVMYAYNMRSAIIHERDKASKAEYQYIRFKQQLSPHFLFNSLNILDSLVCDGQTDQASEYIHKLANVYRYLLRNEEEPLVSLSDELMFVGHYSDLLRVRFSDGFEVEVDVPREDMYRKAVPCAIQLMLENVIKHNAVGGSDKLKVTISSDGNYLTVRNNLCPKVTSSASTGVGLKYLREAYKQLVPSKPITTERTDYEYIVKFPLI